MTSESQQQQSSKEYVCADLKNLFLGSFGHFSEAMIANILSQPTMAAKWEFGQKGR